MFPCIRREEPKSTRAERDEVGTEEENPRDPPRTDLWEEPCHNLNKIYKPRGKKVDSVVKSKLPKWLLEGCENTDGFRVLGPPDDLSPVVLSDMIYFF